MAAGDPPRSAQFRSVVAGHRMTISRIKPVDANAIAAMVTTRAVHVSTISQMDPHMGAVLRLAEENQITRSQLARIRWTYSHRMAEPFLLVGITRKPDPGAGKGGLNQAGTVEIRTDRPSP